MIRWHFIGHLQSNKVKALLMVPNLYMVHSIDRLKIAKLMEKRLTSEERSLRVLIQVNTSGETSKYGCKPEQASQLVDDVTSLTHLQISGLMTIGRLAGGEDSARECFLLLSQLREEIKTSKAGKKLPHLSMGMTSDYKAALKEGSTMVRIGQAIFGERSTLDSEYWPE